MNEIENKYHVLMCICGIQKNGIDELVCKAEMETPMQRTNVGWIGELGLTMCKIDS